MKNFETFIYQNNLELYDQFLKSLIQKVTAEKFEILKNEIFIITRENYTAEYLKLNLVKDGLPSLAFQSFSIKNGISRFIPSTFISENLLSDINGELIIHGLLDKYEKNKFSEKVKRIIAEELFKQREKSIRALDTIQKTHPYYYIFEEFEKIKKNRKTYFEYLKFIFIDSPFTIDERLLKSFFKKTIYCYALFETDRLNFKILEEISKFLKIEFFLTELPLGFQEENSGHDLITSLKPPVSHFFNYSPNVKSDKLKKNPEPDFPISRFAKAMEIRREIEYASRKIMKKIIENTFDPNFKLFHIKLIIPKSELYALTVKEVFDKIKIPVSFTSDGTVKLSPYYSLIIAILRFVESDYESVLFKDIIYNPCFAPKKGNSSYHYQKDLWGEFILMSSIVKFLDDKHKELNGVNPDDYLTWERGWRILIRKIMGLNENGQEFNNNDEIKDEALNFIQISSSFLYDLNFLKENRSNISQKAEFFQIFLKTYLSSNPKNIKGEEILSSQNKDIESIIFRILREMAECKEGVNENESISYSLFANILLKKISELSIGSPHILKKGIVAGTLQDTSDTVFKYIYVLGASENNFNPGIKKNNFDDDKKSNERQLEAILLNKFYFYKIFQHKPIEIFFSFVCLDTIKDSPIYPYHELEEYKKKYFPNEEWENIPLCGVDEMSSKNRESMIWEKEIVHLSKIKQLESKTKKLKFANPVYNADTSQTLKEEIHRFPFGNSIKLKLEKYFLRDHTKTIGKNIPKNKLFLRDFINYCECPQKNLFEKNLDLEEEIIFPEEKFEINHLFNGKILKKMVIDFLNDPTLAFEGIFPDSFFESQFENFQIPSGIPGFLQIEKLKKYFSHFILPLKETILSEYDIVTNISFQNRYQQLGEKKFIVHSPELFGKSLDKGPDLLLFSEASTLSVTIESSPKLKSRTLSLKQKMRSILSAIAILNSNETLTDILKITKSKDLYPAILRIPQDNSPFLLIANKDFNNPDLFKSFFHEYSTGIYPMSPLDINSPPCEYCKINDICFGYKNGIEQFLENDKVVLAKFLKDLFK